MKRILFSLIPAIVLFSLLEFALRLSPWDSYFSPEYRQGSLLDHSVFWRPEPPQHNPSGIAHHAAMEFRGVFHEEKKPQGVFRILCLGGSSTWGWPLEDTEKIYPAVLETMLNRQFSKNKFEVINAGVGGYSTFQVLMYLKQRLLNFSPDLVTLCVGANDSHHNGEIHITLSDKEYSEWLKQESLRPRGEWELIGLNLRRFLQNLRIYNWFDEMLFRLLNKPKQRVPPEDFENNLREIIALGERRHFKILLITEAHRSPDAIVRYVEIMKNLAEANEGVVFIDTRPALEEDSYFVDEMHPTYEGHRVIAGIIFKALINSQIIG
ncbi:MAG: GDSL-like Lipase/Acylhydrolase [Candidatus Omnitrophica bacterium ADurb.Bin277]|nr:MAG: GDSL-like Lipase/Acylhydrolase [Candidatus Omnitrophica bacterium ADurb.Bin277]